ELVEVRLPKPRQQKIRRAALRPVPHRDREGRSAVAVFQPGEKGAQEAESLDVPVVRDALDGGLQQELDHDGILPWRSMWRDREPLRRRWRSREAGTAGHGSGSSMS